MTIVKNILFILFLFAVIPASSQQLPMQEELIIKDSISDFTVDNLGNIYLVTASQQLKKLDNKYDSVGNFNNVRRYGMLYSLDVSNPLRVLLFYKDYNTVLILDRFLNVRTTIDLRRSNLLQCSAIAQSYDNNIWLFDELENKIKKIDENGNLLLESPDFRVLFDAPPRPAFLEDYNRFLYAYDSIRGLLVMDYFGANKNLLAFKGWKNFHGMQSGIVATDSTGIIYYEPGTLNTEHYLLPALLLKAIKIRVSGSKLYALLQDKRLHIYQLQNNR